MLFKIISAFLFIAIIICVVFIVKSNRTILRLNKDKKEDEKYINALISESENARTDAMSKQDFISKMSHDIRVPIMGIHGLSEITQQLVKEKDNDEKVFQNISKIDSLSDYIIKLLDDVTSIYESNFEDYIDNPMISFNMGEWYEAMLKRIAPHNKAGITLETKINEQLKSKNFIGDSEKLAQIFDLILMNALEYSDKGSVLKFEISYVEEGTLSEVKFFMSDTKQSITNEKFMAKVFNPYIEDDDVAIQSNGLGVSVVKMWVSNLNGDIMVGENDDGTIYGEIVIPFVALDNVVVDSEYHEAEKKVEIDFNGMHALVAEDNEINREVAVEILKSAGFIVDSCEDGREAIEKFNASTENYYDVILMDIMMPDKNGWEASIEIRSLDRSDAKNVVIIAMSGNVFDDDIRRSLESGMNGHIKKPIDVNTLFKSIKSYLN